MNLKIKMMNKSPKDSFVSSRHLILPNQINNNGTLFGGELLSMIDKIAAMAAQKHAETEVTTAAISSMAFLSPVYKNEHLILEAEVAYVGNTSMDVFIKVTKENIQTKTIEIISTAIFVFVSIDKNNNPLPVIKLIPKTLEEKERYNQLKKRKNQKY